MDSNNRTSSNRISLSAAAVSLMLLIFSLICWISFAKDMLGIMSGDPAEESTASAADTHADIFKATASGTELASLGNLSVLMSAESSDTAVDSGAGISDILNIDTLISDMDSVWNGAIPAKSSLSVPDVIGTYIATGEISSTQTLRGKQGWLFYKTDFDGDPIADYEGTNLVTDEYLSYIGEVSRCANEAMQERGIRFVVFIAPNKERVYSEYMPDTYTLGTESKYEQYIDTLRDNGLEVVNPYEDLISVHDYTDLFYHYDTHWNQAGGYTAVRSLLGYLGIDMPDLTDCSVTEESVNYEGYPYVKEDLVEVAGLSGFFTDEKEYHVDGTQAIDWETYDIEQNENNSYSHFTNESAPIDETLLLVGDSFRSNMLPSLCSMYREVYVIHRLNYNCSMLDEFSPDIVVAEYVERYVNEIEGIYSLVM